MVSRCVPGTDASVRCEGMWIVRYLSAGVRVSMHPYQWSREVCVIANYITLRMVSRPDGQPSCMSQQPSMSREPSVWIVSRPDGQQLISHHL